MGKVRYTEAYEGLISNIVLSVPQVFHRVPMSSVNQQHEVRFDFFVKKILPALRRSNIEQPYTLILVSHYFEYLKITKYLEDHNYSFRGISEYSTRSQTDRARHEFQNGETKILVYTERCHFFRRNRLKNVKHIVFYSPLLFQFYADFVNLMQDDVDSSCDVLYSRYDRLKLERIVGSERIETMIKGEKEAYMFSN
jgi:U3 small nucleolar RNA-associated protein 25